VGQFWSRSKKRDISSELGKVRKSFGRNATSSFLAAAGIYALGQSSGALERRSCSSEKAKAKCFPTVSIEYFWRASPVSQPITTISVIARLGTEFLQRISCQSRRKDYFKSVQVLRPDLVRFVTHHVLEMEHWRSLGSEFLRCFSFGKWRGCQISRIEIFFSFFKLRIDFQEVST